MKSKISEKITKKLDKYMDVQKWFTFARPKKKLKSPYASVNDRVFASVLDSIWSLLLLAPIFMIISNIIFGKNSPERISQFFITQNPTMQGVMDMLSYPDFLQNFALNNLIQIVIMGIVLVIMWKYSSSTPGKWLLKMRIIDADSGEAPSNRQLIIRYFGYFVSALPFMLGFLWIYFDKRHQCWHDKMSNTVVVKVKKWNHQGKFLDL